MEVSDSFDHERTSNSTNQSQTAGKTIGNQRPKTLSPTRQFEQLSNKPYTNNMQRKQISDAIYQIITKTSIFPHFKVDQVAFLAH